jgi:choline dehydrogenase-like flavoprotein
MINDLFSNKIESQYDAIVVGSGISGGWAAKELTEKGLKVLMVDRGRELKHIEDYSTALSESWDLKHRGRLSIEDKAKFPIQSREGAYPIHEGNKDFWLVEKEQAYQQTQAFEWFRPSISGGKSMLWGRQVYRWSDLDFEANLKDGHGVDWPLRYKDIAPWYDYVERFIGVSAKADGIPHLPDGIFQPAMDLNCLESHVAQSIKENYAETRLMTIGRVAHITQPTEEQKALGRASCQYRNKCSQGCPYGAYFSTQSATLPAAQKTGNLTLLTESIAQSVLFDSQKNKAKGLLILDKKSLKSREISARLVFVCASTVASTQLLLHSKSDRFPSGLGNDSGALGKYLMDHHSRVGASARFDGFKDRYYYGRRANGIFIPRYRNLGHDKREYLRGFDFQGGAQRAKPGSTEEFGAKFKLEQTGLGEWQMSLHGYGECLPYAENQMTLSENQVDAFGLPQIVFDASFKENEVKMRLEMQTDAAEMLEIAGLKDIKSYNQNVALGLSKHEMGTVRMGRDPKTSVLNGYNQMWSCKNVFVTDGSAFASSGCVNPSLSYMALTARAADFAVSEMKKRNL